MYVHIYIIHTAKCLGRCRPLPYTHILSRKHGTTYLVGLEVAESSIGEDQSPLWRQAGTQIVAPHGSHVILLYLKNAIEKRS